MRTATLAAAVLAAAAVTGCGTTTGGGATTTTKTSSTTASTPRTPASSAVARRVRRDIRETVCAKGSAASWCPLLGKVTAAADGYVTVDSRIGDDANGQGPLTALCGNVGPLAGEKGVTGLELTGIDRYGNRGSSIGKCPGS